MSDHTPVLVREVIELFHPKPGDVLLDATLGHGGHAKAFLDAAGSGAKVIGIDADEEALTVAKEKLKAFGDNVTYLKQNFAELPDVKVNAILFDLGIGSHQIADDARGFSFSSEGPLTMQYGAADSLPDANLEPINVLTRRLNHYPDASELLDFLSPMALADMVKEYGEERYAGVVGNAIAGGRPFASAKKLASVIEKAVPKFYEKGRIHPATRTFQALRLATNRELEVLESVLSIVAERLLPSGVLAVISFHSLEDRIVKHYFRKASAACICPIEQPICNCEYTPQLTILTKRPIIAGEEERERNPRSRSAKLRAARRRSP
ncbi:MAG: 16S rRNA (cytosine(1402)-N(4))-methyltransferase RsmH [bacterium]|nr:16S rRNA (cytosine(1402)-N(4))-methyltransferase RsmH [bacterium]